MNYTLNTGCVMMACINVFNRLQKMRGIRGQGRLNSSRLPCPSPPLLMPYLLDNRDTKKNNKKNGTENLARCLTARVTRNHGHGY